MNNAIITFYCVGFGPNSRHLIDARSFDLLRDAKKFINELSITSAYKMTRHEGTAFATGDQINIKTIDERIK